MINLQTPIRNKKIKKGNLRLPDKSIMGSDRRNNHPLLKPGGVPCSDQVNRVNKKSRNNQESVSDISVCHNYIHCSVYSISPLKIMKTAVIVLWFPVQHT